MVGKITMKDYVMYIYKQPRLDSGKFDVIGCLECDGAFEGFFGYVYNEELETFERATSHEGDGETFDSYEEMLIGEGYKLITKYTQPNGVRIPLRKEHTLGYKLNEDKIAEPWWQESPF